MITGVILVFCRRRRKEANSAVMDANHGRDDSMLGPPSPLIPLEIASHVLQGVDTCDGILRNLFLCLQINDIEPFCQDEIVLYRQCAEKRDKEPRQRLQESERKLGSSMPLEGARERAAHLRAQVTSLERRMILASGVEGMEGFRQRWSLYGRLEDTKRRLEALNQGMADKKDDQLSAKPQILRGKYLSKNDPSASKHMAMWGFSVFDPNPVDNVYFIIEHAVLRF